MDTLPLHPTLVHLPIALALVMPFLTAAVAAAWARSVFTRASWWLVIAFQAVLLGGAGAALRSGESEEDRVAPLVGEPLVEAHEEAAQAFTAGAAAVLGVAILAGFTRRRTATVALVSLSIAGTLVVLLLGFRAGHAGGELVYRYGAAAAYVQPGAASPLKPGANQEDDQEDDEERK